MHTYIHTYMFIHAYIRTHIYIQIYTYIVHIRCQYVIVKWMNPIFINLHFIYKESNYLI